MRKTGLFIAAFLFTLQAIAAQARDSEGKTGFIVDPLSTRPAFALPGGTITVDVAEKIYNSCSCAFGLFLDEGGAQTRLETSRVTETPPVQAPGSAPEPGIYRFTARIPESAKPGIYDLRARKGTNMDVSLRSVAVLEKSEGRLTILHAADARTGAAGGKNAARLEALAEVSNELKPDVVVLIGDLTENGTAAEFKNFLEVRNRFDAPTIVIPGSRDTAPGEAESFLGPGGGIVPLGSGALIPLQEDGAIPPGAGPADLKKFKPGIFVAYSSGAWMKNISDTLPADKTDIILLGPGHGESAERGKAASVVIRAPLLSEDYYGVIEIVDSGFESGRIEKLPGTGSE